MLIVIFFVYNTVREGRCLAKKCVRNLCTQTGWVSQLPRSLHPSRSNLRVKPQGPATFSIPIRTRGTFSYYNL